MAKKQITKTKSKAKPKPRAKKAVPKKSTRQTNRNNAKSSVNIFGGAEAMVQAQTAVLMSKAQDYENSKTQYRNEIIAMNKEMANLASYNSSDKQFYQQKINALETQMSSHGANIAGQAASLAAMAGGGAGGIHTGPPPARPVGPTVVPRPGAFRPRPAPFRPVPAGSPGGPPLPARPDPIRPISVAPGRSSSGASVATGRLTAGGHDRSSAGASVATGRLTAGGHDRSSAGASVATGRLTAGGHDHTPVRIDGPIVGSVIPSTARPPAKAENSIVRAHKAVLAEAVQADVLHREGFKTVSPRSSQGSVLSQTDLRSPVSRHSGTTSANPLERPTPVSKIWGLDAPHLLRADKLVTPEPRSRPASASPTPSQYTGRSPAEAPRKGLVSMKNIFKGAGMQEHPPTTVIRRTPGQPSPVFSHTPSVTPIWGVTGPFVGTAGRAPSPSIRHLTAEEAGEPTAPKKTAPKKTASKKTAAKKTAPKKT